MTEDLLGYNEMVETAMRSVVRQALEKAGEDGLPGDHHFYITFRTDHPDVIVPVRLRERYPEEMTIVLQHQFWGLNADAEGFEVDLSFNQKLEHLRIPFDALITFADPSVNFGLQFHVDPNDDSYGADQMDVEPDPGQDDASGGPVDHDHDDDDPKGDGDNVVALDTFRKNK